MAERLHFRIRERFKQAAAAAAAGSLGKAEILEALNHFVNKPLDFVEVTSSEIDDVAAAKALRNAQCGGLP